MKIRNILLATAALVGVGAATVASAGARQEAIQYYKAQKQDLKDQKLTVKQQYLNGDITRQEKKDQLSDINDQRDQVADQIDELKASK